jgi:drug/metabolite transporter (DMT)-like permease
MKGVVRPKGDNGTLLSVVVTAIASGLVWLALGGDIAANGSSSDVWLGAIWFAVSGLLSTAVGRIFFYRSVHDLGVVHAAAVRRINPFFSVLLAWLVLGELINLTMGLGLGLIATSFIMLLVARYRLGRRIPERAEVPVAPVAGYIYGVASGGAYAFGLLARKFGLAGIANPSLGTFIGALAAIIFYVIASAWVADYRRAFRDLITTINPWQLLAALLISAGQITQFAALQYTTVLRVAIISSLEIFISILLAVYVFRTESRLALTTLFAVVLGTVGVVLVALG